MNLDPKRIAIIGAGGIGGFVGLMLSRAGFDVHYLLRSNFETLRENGLSLKSAEFGDYALTQAQVYNNPQEMPACDWLFVATKTTENPTLAPLLNSIGKPGARIILLQNGLLVEEKLRPGLDRNFHLLGGLPIISAHRHAPGVIHHYAYGRINLGYHSGPVPEGKNSDSAILNEAVSLLRAARIDARLTDNLASLRWQKLVMNVPFSGLTVTLNCSTRALMSQDSTRTLVQELMQEVAAGAAACDHSLPSGYLEEAWAANEIGNDFRSSMSLDYENRRPLELEAIYLSPLAEAAKFGCEMPKVKMLYQLLRFLDKRNLE